MRLMNGPDQPLLTHLDRQGQAAMVDVGGKDPSWRRASASCVVRMSSETLERYLQAALEKGDALAVARIAGIGAAKRTHELIPLCHPLSISHASIDFEPLASRRGLRVISSVACFDRTGVEMEALTAAAVAGLTLIDMGKGVERGIYIELLRLEAKSGGRSGSWQRPEAEA